MAFHYLSVIPAKDFRKHLNNVNYEPLLDLILNPSVENDPRLIEIINFNNIVCLHHIKVEFSSLEKVLTVFEIFNQDCDVIFGSIAVLFHERENLNSAELFKCFHILFDSKQMNFELIASAYLYKAIFVQLGKIAKLYRDYAWKHNLVFKSLLKIGEIFDN